MTTMTDRDGPDVAQDVDRVDGSGEDEGVEARKAARRIWDILDRAVRFNAAVDEAELAAIVQEAIDAARLRRATVG